MKTNCETHNPPHLIHAKLIPDIFWWGKWNNHWNDQLNAVKDLYYMAQLSEWLSLTHWGRVTHICVSDLTSIGSDNGLSPGRRQAIIRTNAGILLIRPLGTNFSEFLVEILIFSFKKMRLKVSSAKRRPFCLCLNELTAFLEQWTARSMESTKPV